MQSAAVQSSTPARIEKQTTVILRSLFSPHRKPQMRSFKQASASQLRSVCLRLSVHQAQRPADDFSSPMTHRQMDAKLCSHSCAFTEQALCFVLKGDTQVSTFIVRGHRPTFVRASDTVLGTGLMRIVLASVRISRLSSAPIACALSV